MYNQAKKYMLTRDFKSVDWGVCAKERTYVLDAEKMQKSRKVFRQQKELAWESGKCLEHGHLQRIHSEFSRFVPSMLQDPE